METARICSSSLITDEEHRKLSKRSDIPHMRIWLNRVPPEAIINFVALLDGVRKARKRFSLKELIRVFDYKRVNKSPAVFDIETPLDERRIY